MRDRHTSVWVWVWVCLGLGMKNKIGSNRRIINPIRLRGTLMGWLESASDMFSFIGLAAKTD